MTPGDTCPVHGKVDLVEQRRRQLNSQAFDRLVKLAQIVGWAELERRVKAGDVQAGYG